MIYLNMHIFSQYEQVVAWLTHISQFGVVSCNHQAVLVFHSLVAHYDMIHLGESPMLGAVPADGL